MYKTIDFLGVEISAITKDGIVDEIINFALMGKHKMITYLNAHCMNVSFYDFEYREILKAADLVYAGGMGIVWASKFFGKALPERINILDFFDKLTEQMREKRLRIYLLGGKIDVVKKTEQVLKERGLRIIGSSGGFFNETEEAGIIKEINELRPDILIVGMGVPKQEKWIYSHLDELNINLSWAVGAAFDWLSGYRKRAPKWMVSRGLEWLHRLSQEPGRLWKRYLIGNFVYIYRVLKYKF